LITGETLDGLPPRKLPGRQGLRQEDHRLPRVERSEETGCESPDGKALCSMDDPWERMLVAPPAAASSHLSDGELFASQTPSLSKHLADCAWCRYRLDAVHTITAAEAEDDEDFEQRLRAGNWRDDFAQVSREAVLPDQVRAAMTAPASVGDVEPGQLWRITWRGHHLLMAVIEVADWQVLSAPVTTDVNLADELTLLVKAAQSPLGTDLAIWVRNRVAVPLFVFGRPLGMLPPMGRAHLSGQAALEQLTRAHTTGSAVSSDLPTGRPLTDNDMDRLAIHDALWEQTDWFTAASAGLIDSDGLLTTARKPPGTRQDSARPLSDVLRDSGLSLPELAARTGLKMGRLVDLARTDATASPQEIAAIEGATRRAVAIDYSDQQLKVVTALTEVSRPAWRAARQRWTQHKNRDVESEDPTTLVRHLLEQPMAARSTYQEQEPADERQRLRQYWRERVAMVLNEYQ